MNKTTKIIIGVIIVVAVVAIGYFVSKGPSEPASTEPIKIGFIGSLSGSQATYGEGIKQGFDLAIEEGKTKFKGRDLKIIYEDTQSNPGNAVSAALKLISIDKVSAIIHGGGSQEAVPLIKVVEENKIPMYATLSQAPELTKAGDFVFRNEPEIKVLGEKVASLVHQRGLKKAASINAVYNEAVVAARDAFEETFKSLGGEIVARESFDKGTNDFRTQLLKIKTASPDVIFLNVLTTEAGLVLRQMRELGLEQQVVSQGAVEDEKVVELSGEASEGLIFATFNAVPPQDFVNKIKAKYGFEYRRWIMEGYEAGLFLLAALNNAKGFSPLELQEAFSSVKELEGVTGLLTYDEEGNISRPVFIKEIKDGKFQLLNE